MMKSASSPAVRTPIGAYLKLFGLGMYARKLSDHKLGELEDLAKLSDTEALEACEAVRVYPGHKIKLLRAIDLLRRATETSEHDNIDVFDRLMNERDYGEEQNQVLAAENAELIGHLRAQESLIMEMRMQQHELQELVMDRTAQCEFLSEQMEYIMMMQQFGGGMSMGMGMNMDMGGLDESCDWGDATRFSFDETLSRAKIEEIPSDEDEDSPIRKKIHPAMLALLNGTATSLRRSMFLNPEKDDKAEKTEKTDKAEKTDKVEKTDKTEKKMKKTKLETLPESMTSSAVPSATVTPCRNAPKSELDESPVRAPSRAQSSTTWLHDVDDDMPQTGSPTTNKEERMRKLGMSLDSAQVSECLAGFDVDHLLRCLAKAVQNSIILSMSSPRPHGAPDKFVAECVTFLDPQARQKLDAQKDREKCDGPFYLNDIAFRHTPNLWAVYTYFNDIMANFQLEQECAVITLIYLKRFTDVSKVSMTPDSWQRLAITAMMLASKVWDDESYENREFSQLCPLYTIDEINSFEKVFLRGLKYDVSVKGSEYASTYFLLRTIGAKDLPGEFKIPAELEPARCSKLMDHAQAKQTELRSRYLGSDDDMMNWTF